MSISRNKKAQEEIMGFVILIVVVIIISIVFFGFSLRKTATFEPKLNEMDDFIQAALSYTTDCRINAESQNIRDVIKYCNTNPDRICENNNVSVCIELNSTMNSIVYKLLGTQIANSYVHGYVLNISNSGNLAYIEKGNLTGSYFASSTAIPSGDSGITLKLKFYYAKA